MQTRVTLPRPRKEPKLRTNAKTGVYQLFFYNPERSPRRKSLSMTTRDRRKAERTARPYIDAWMAGLWDPWIENAFVKGVSIDKAIEEYAEHKRARGEWRQRTAADRRHRLKRFAATLAPGITVAMVTSKDIEAFILRAPMGHEDNARNVQDPDKISARSSRTYHSQLKTFFAWCVSSGYLERSPVDGVARPKEPRAEEPIHLTPNEFRRILDAVRLDYATKKAAGKLNGPWPRQIIHFVDTFEFAAYTGLRPSEMRRLRWKDIDRDRGMIYVRHVDGVKTKNEHQRTVPILAPLLPVLDRLAQIRTTENDADPVIPSPKPGPNGKPMPMSIQSTSREFKKYARSVGLEDVSFYALRRSTGTWLVNNGARIEVAQDIFGHASIKTTEKHYAAFWKSTVIREAEEAIRRALLDP